ncbi:NfeD family protein [Fodinibius salinus]|uniref:NfeD family protein n=1 Tax=Fodinibius salinus TaxID=860790 RepID=UPI0014793110
MSRLPLKGGRVFVNGEYWNAVSEKNIQEGKWCKVVSIDGLTITVEPTDDHS